MAYAGYLDTINYGHIHIRNKNTDGDVVNFFTVEQGSRKGAPTKKTRYEIKQDPKTDAYFAVPLD